MNQIDDPDSSPPNQPRSHQWIQRKFTIQSLKSTQLYSLHFIQVPTPSPQLSRKLFDGTDTQNVQ